MINWHTKESLKNLQHINMLTPIIAENRITMFSSKAGSGKTTVIISQIKNILDVYKNKKIIYFDYDGGFHRSKESEFLSNELSSELNETESFADKRVMIAGIDSDDEHGSVIDVLEATKEDANRCVLIIDGVQTFVSKHGIYLNKNKKENGDFNYSINNNDGISRLMEYFKKLRKQGYTIILIHHANKGEEALFRGAQALEDSVDSHLGIKGKVIKDPIHGTILTAKIIFYKFSGDTYYAGYDSLNIEVMKDSSFTYIDADNDTKDIEIKYPLMKDSSEVDENILNEILILCNNKKKTDAINILKKEYFSVRNARKMIDLLIDTGVVYEEILQGQDRSKILRYKKGE